jgi:hypothetical protein
VRRLDARGDLHRQLDRLVDRQRPAVEPVGERLALDILEHEVPRPVLLLDAVDPGEVRMVQPASVLASRSKRSSLAGSDATPRAAP